MRSIYLDVKLTYENTFAKKSLHEKWPYSAFFWSIFSRIWTEYLEIRSISPYLVRMRENTNQKNSKYDSFWCSEYDCFYLKKHSFREVIWTVKLFSPQYRDYFITNWHWLPLHWKHFYALLLRNKGKKLWMKGQHSNCEARRAGRKPQKFSLLFLRCISKWKSQWMKKISKWKTH